MIRNYIKGETLPEELRTGFESAANVDPEWIWICEHDGLPTAILVTAPCHCAVMLLRMVSTKESNPMDVRSLLLHAIVSLKSRGFGAYFTWIDPTQDIERSLMNIIRHAGGHQFTNPQVLCAGRA